MTCGLVQLDIWPPICLYSVSAHGANPTDWRNRMATKETRKSSKGLKKSKKLGSIKTLTIIGISSGGGGGSGAGKP